jgi:hypothetical protein
MSNLVPLLIRADGQVVVQGLEVTDGVATVPVTINQTFVENRTTVHPVTYETRVERVVEVRYETRVEVQPKTPVVPQRTQALPPPRPGNVSKAAKPTPVAVVSRKPEPDPRFAQVRTLEDAMKLLGRGEKLDKWEAMRINDRMIEDGWAG